MTPSIGLDVHQATISAAVRDSDGKLVLEAILETKAETMLRLSTVCVGTTFLTIGVAGQTTCEGSARLRGWWSLPSARTW
jgi:hypothetical protein